MHKLLEKHIEKAPLPTHIPILQLVAAFGLTSKRDFCMSDETHKDSWDIVHGTDNQAIPFGYHDHAPAAIEEVLWRSIRPILRSRICYGTNKDLVLSWKNAEMREIAALTAFPWKTHWEKICRSLIPVPKSWGKGIDPITLQITAEHIKEVRNRSNVQKAKTKAA
jgi:hypothetical protein